MYTSLLLILVPLIIGYLLPRPLAAGRKPRLKRHGVRYPVFNGHQPGVFTQSRQQPAADRRDYRRQRPVYSGDECAGAGSAGKLPPWPAAALTPPPSRWRMVLDSLKLCAVVVAGFALGLTHWSGFSLAIQASELLLILLLWLVGIQLRQQRHDAQTDSSQLPRIAGGTGGRAKRPGRHAAGLPLTTGLALASAYGWYSLSGILMTDAFGPVIGSVAFFNDLLRELLEIMLIPLLIRRDAIRRWGCAHHLDGFYPAGAAA